MQHPVLGQLQEDRGFVVGGIRLDGVNISVRVDPDDAPLDQALSLAGAIASSLADYDRTSKDVIVRDLLETYNSGWNEYNEVQEDGSIKSVVNPKLSPDEFKHRLTLSSVGITGDYCVDLWYEDDGLFGGHGIFVQSLDGTDFSNSEAQLFG